MRHLFIVDPLARLDVEKDTTIALMREAQRRGEEVFTAEISSLGIAEGGRPRVRAVSTEADAGDPWYRTGAPLDLMLDQFDVIWMRKDPPYDLGYFYVTHVLELARPPTLVLNDPRGLRDVTEKLFGLRFPEISPESMVSSQIEEILSFREKVGGDIVIKPLDGAGGEGVFHLGPGDRNVRAILETATRHGTRYQLAQRYIPEIRQGDKRIILLQGRPIGAVLRVPLPGETRANFHVGGSAERAELTPRDLEICEQLRPALLERGIFFAGIDVIGEWLTEVNVTSPTGICEINALDGACLETEVLEAAEQLWKERAGS